jgi:hypothetical protein
MEVPIFVYQAMMLFFLINGWFGVTKKTMVTPLGGIIMPYLPGKDPLLDKEKPILFGFAKLSSGEYLFGLGIFQLIIGIVLLVLYLLVFIL